MFNASLSNISDMLSGSVRFEEEIELCVEITDKPEITDKTLSHNIIPLYGCEFNFSDDGTDCIGRPSYHTKTDITITNAYKMQKYVSAWNYTSAVQPWMPDTVNLSIPLQRHRPSGKVLLISLFLTCICYYFI
jgi:hypothetical protein